MAALFERHFPSLVTRQANSGRAARNIAFRIYLGGAPMSTGVRLVTSSSPERRSAPRPIANNAIRFPHGFAHYQHEYPYVCGRFDNPPLLVDTRLDLLALF